MLGLKFDWWVVWGLIAQTLFTGRFLVQWLASEKARRSVVPNSFWLLSIGGSGMLLAYAIIRADPVFILGQSFGAIVYLRNLRLIDNEKTAEDIESASVKRRRLMPVGLALLTLIAVVALAIVFVVAPKISNSRHSLTLLSSEPIPVEKIAHSDEAQSGDRLFFKRYADGPRGEIRVYSACPVSASMSEGKLSFELSAIPTEKPMLYTFSDYK